MTATNTQPTVINGLDTRALKGLIDNVAADPANGRTHWHATTRWAGGAKTATHVDHYEIGSERIEKDWTIHTDEPIEIGGTNTAANPQEVLIAGLNACMTVGYAAVGALMGIEIQSLEIETQGEIDLRGFLGLDQAVPNGYPELRYTVRIKADATKERLEELHAAVQATSPNFYNLAHAVPMRAELAVG